MSFNEIKIARTLPVVGGYVKIADDNNNLPKVTPSEVPYDDVKFGVTTNLEFIEFPEESINAASVIDYQQTVRGIAEAKL